MSRMIIDVKVMDYLLEILEIQKQLHITIGDLKNNDGEYRQGMCAGIELAERKIKKIVKDFERQEGSGYYGED